MSKNIAKIAIFRATQYGLCYTSEFTIKPGALLEGISLIPDKHNDPDLKKFLLDHETAINIGYQGYGSLHSLFLEVCGREPTTKNAPK